MNTHVGKRLFVVAAVLAAVALFATGFFVALGVRSVVAGPDSAPAAQEPVVSHTHDQIELPAGTWTGLDADTVDGAEASALEESAEIDTDVAAHAGDPAAHHTKTTDASEIVSGTMAPERIEGTAWTSLNDGDGSGLDADTVDGQEAGALLPPGVIVMWSGTLATIPSGWALCDGTNGTPDLRDKFVYGVSAGQNPGETGGSTTHSHTVDPHSHNINLQVRSPGWRLLSAGYYNYDVAGSLSSPYSDLPTKYGYNYAADVGGTYQNLYSDYQPGDGITTFAKWKSEIIVEGSTGSSTAGTSDANHLPSYYKLALIMKL